MGQRCYGRAMADDVDHMATGLEAHFAAMRGELLRFLAARMGSSADAEDLMQDMWLRLSRAETGPVGNPRAYLFRMALNIANDLVRERSRRRVRDTAWSDSAISERGGIAIDETPSAEQMLIDKRELAQLQQIIHALPDRARDVFCRHRLSEQSHGEIAAALGISKSAVEKHMANAMRHIATAINKVDET